MGLDPRFWKNRTEPEPLRYKLDKNPNKTEPKQLGFFPIRHPIIQTAKETQT